MNIHRLIDEFVNQLYERTITIYNEFSLQHELGIFLREKMPDFKIEFERNAKDFFRIKDTVKREIDIVMYNEDRKEGYAIELKYPRNGQYPKQMGGFIEDIQFMEQIKHDKTGTMDFKQTFCLIFVDDNNFFDLHPEGSKGPKRKADGIYKYFRMSARIGEDNSQAVMGLYQIEWKPWGNDEDCRYYFLEVQ